MKTNCEIHWAIVYRDGAIAYDRSGRAHIYSTRQEARDALSAASDEAESTLYVEKRTVNSL